MLPAASPASHCTIAHWVSHRTYPALWDSHRPYHQHHTIPLHTGSFSGHILHYGLVTGQHHTVPVPLYWISLRTYPALWNSQHHATCNIGKIRTISSAHNNMHSGSVTGHVLSSNTLWANCRPNLAL